MLSPPFDSQLWEKGLHDEPEWFSLPLRHPVLVFLDQLVQAEQAAEPAARVLQAGGDLVHELGPALGEVVLDDLADTQRQLNLEDGRDGHHGLNYVVPVTWERNV